MSRPIPKTYTLEMYMKKMKDQDIRSDAYVQRMAGQWSNEMINELIYTVLNDNSEEDDGYIPPIILGEDYNSQLWIIDGLQRSTSLILFRYFNYKITSVMDNTFITYKEKMCNSNGNIIKDECGNIMWRDVEYNLKGKTFEMLPDELKKIFDEYQIDTVTHRKCDMERMSKLIKKYNNHASMNSVQKAFTCVGKYARNVRDILNEKFFTECYDEKDKMKGNLERIILETIMVTYHLEDWKKGVKQLAQYINNNSNEKEFDEIHNNIRDLESVLTSETKPIFNIKDSFIWISLFNKFKEYELPDNKFIDFITQFSYSLHNKSVDGKVFDTIDKDKGTKDKSVVMDKLRLLQTLMMEYLHINKQEIQTEENNVLDFIHKNVGQDIKQEDIVAYSEDFDVYTLEVDNNSKLMNDKNRPSMIALIAYSYKEDKRLDEWFVDYFKRNNTYIQDQKQNYILMKNDLEKYLHKQETKTA